MELIEKNNASNKVTLIEKTYNNIISLSPNTEERIIFDFENNNFVSTGKDKTFGVFVR